MIHLHHFTSFIERKNVPLQVDPIIYAELIGDQWPCLTCPNFERGEDGGILHAQLKTI